MAEKANVAYFGAGTISIGGDGYTAAVNSATLTPTYPTGTFTDIGGDVQSLVGKPSWVLALGYAQDWTTEDSLSQKLLADAGEIEPIVYTPQDGGQGFTVQARIISGPIGGAGSAIHQSTVNLPVSGQPVIAPAAP